MYKIAIEGAECTGKTTLINNLNKLFQKNGITTSINNEFSQSEYITERIEHSLSNSLFISEGFDKGPEMAFFFMLFATASNIIHTSDKQEYTLFDRHLLSLSIYEGLLIQNKKDINDVIQLHKIVSNTFNYFDFGKLDICIILNIDENTLQQRFLQREGRLPTNSELKNINKIRKCYKIFSDIYPSFILIDAQKSEEELSNDVFKLIKEYSEKQK